MRAACPTAAAFLFLCACIARAAREPARRPVPLRASPAQTATAPRGAFAGLADDAESLAQRADQRQEVALIPEGHVIDFWPESWREACAPERKISSGQFGQVVKARLACSGSNDHEHSFRVAVKTQADERQDLMHNEVRMMERFKGPPFITLYQWENYSYACGAPSQISVTGHVNGSAMIMAMEYVDGPSLAELIRRRVPTHLLLSLFTEVLFGIRIMSEAGYLHRDIKPDNVMVVGDCLSPEGCHVRIIDFGFACAYKLGVEDGVRPCASIDGTPLYIPPEVFEQFGSTPDFSFGNNDVWSAGIALYSILCGGFPRTWERLVASTLHRRQNLAPDAWDVKDEVCYEKSRRGILSGWAELMADMLTSDPSARVSARGAHERALALLERYNPWGRGLAANASSYSSTSSLGEPPPEPPLCWRRPRVSEKDIVTVHCSGTQRSAAAWLFVFLLAAAGRQ